MENSFPNYFAKKEVETKINGRNYGQHVLPVMSKGITIMTRGVHTTTKLNTIAIHYEAFLCVLCVFI